ncbi:Pentatricopeptide repeat-containing protein [Acorus calamus]|uniref:Pentatricopeptide repeat-containing protein n=1 Tax=Acorus calamus TaxID=4465 RepID=A0AAV9FBN2_ACOCL|nr:Pentatricopeptide repeat-containing protein [Acorus calamus]
MARKAGDLHLPNSTAFADLLNSSISSASLRGCHRVHACLLKTRFSSEPFILNRLIDAYAKCGSPSDALRMFDRMPLRNVFTHNAVLRAFSASGLLDQAERLILTMPHATSAPGTPSSPLTRSAAALTPRWATSRGCARSLSS